MPGSIIPILLLGGGAMLVMKKKKKKKKPVDTTPTIEQPVANLPPMVAPPTKKKAGTTVWKKRQQAAVNAGYDVGRAGVDGIPGPDTREAIMEFQKDAGITIDAKWGAETSAAMAQALKMAAQGLGKAAYRQIGGMLGKFKSMFDKFLGGGEDQGLPPMVTPPQTKGSLNAWAQRQKSLLKLGYDIGRTGVDGKPGPKTRKAIMEFQKDAGITVDAKWGAQTAAGIAQALRMVMEGLGKAAYSQIGSMLGKFSDMFKKFGQGKEEGTDLGTFDVTGLEPTDEEIQKDQLRMIAGIQANPLLDPDRYSVEEVLIQLQGIHGLNMTGRWDVATRILVNELLAEGA